MMAALRTVLSLAADAVIQIKTDCEAIILQGEESHGPAGLAGCGTALVGLLGEQATQILRFYESTTNCISRYNNTTKSEEYTVLKRLDDLISIAYAKFYVFLFKDLPFCWRQLYTDASILKFSLLLFRACSGHEPSSKGTTIIGDPEISELTKVLDLALVLAGAAGEQRGRKWIDKAFEQLDRAWASDFADQDGTSTQSTRPTKRFKRDGSDKNQPFSIHEPFTPQARHPVARTSGMSMESFQRYMDQSSNTTIGPEPLIFTDLIDSWPARRDHPWCMPTYLLSRTFNGRRIVPVEIGRSYVDEGWGQKLITFREFLHDYIDPGLKGDRSAIENPISSSDRPTAYLAQHPLFTQLPTLRKDILVPDFCYTSPPPHPFDSHIDQPELDEPLLNAWFGPPGTITPLHNDPYHNLLAQVVGRKYVRLYPPLETNRMLARGKEHGVEMGNTSSLDVGVLEGWDHPDQGRELDASEQEKIEQMRLDFKDVPFVDCILMPGDTLYIPIGWWHYVRGLSVSFSVSFWWN
ncbi:hypothetical protein BX600DRAFT_16048 [Xylariales sp. PMI_506]|nr:hypothetical protein BX600DRAFT_16048 [Xylariales sp. PMI_506]